VVVSPTLSNAWIIDGIRSEPIRTVRLSNAPSAMGVYASVKSLSM
jgi:hypothetical protein